MVIFGLPGDKHDDDPARAVIAGHRIMEILHTHLEITYVHSFDRGVRVEKTFMQTLACQLANYTICQPSYWLTFLLIVAIKSIQTQIWPPTLLSFWLHAHSIFYFSIFLCLFRNESIGITTGRAFCGVVGHLDRHEYTGKQSLTTEVLSLQSQ